MVVYSPPKYEQINTDNTTRHERPNDDSSQNRSVSTIRVERIDPNILHLVDFLFPAEPFPGLQSLALLCRNAFEKQSSMFPGYQSIAVLTFHGMQELCTIPGWYLKYHATWRYLLILQALEVLMVSRKQRTTEIIIPLGTRQEPPHIQTILTNLTQIHKTYKDKKLLQLVERVETLITTYSSSLLLSDLGDSENQTIDPLVLKALQRQLVSTMRAEHIPMVKCQRVARSFTAQIPILQKQALSQQWDEKELSGDSLAHVQRSAGRYLPTSGDMKLPREYMGDSLNTSTFAQNSVESPDFSGKQGQHISQNSPKFKEKGQDSVSAEHKHESILFSTIASSKQNQFLGECEDASSSIDSITSVISLIEKHDIEEDLAIDQKSSQWAKSDEALHNEVIQYILYLEGVDKAQDSYLETNEGKRLYHQIRNYLEKDPSIARVSAVNALMEVHFYDVKGRRELKRPAAWFANSFKLYTKPGSKTGLPLEITGEIASWAASPYSIAQIEQFLALEKKRQLYDFASGEHLHCPFASCVEEHHWTYLQVEDAVTADENNQQTLENSPDMLDIPAISETPMDDTDEPLNVFFIPLLSLPSPIRNNVISLEQVFSPDCYEICAWATSDGCHVLLDVCEHSSQEPLCTFHNAREIKEFLQSLYEDAHRSLKSRRNREILIS